MSPEETRENLGSPAPSASQPPLTPPPPPPLPPLGASFPQAVRLPPERKKWGCGWWVLGIAAIGIFACLLLLLLWGLGAVAEVEGTGSVVGTRGGRSMVEETVQGSGSQKLLVIPVTGIIGAVPSPFGEGGDSVAMIEEMLKNAEADSSIKAILLYVDSPGGGITASDVIRHDLVAFRDRTHLPVVALLGDVAASGGYYVASSADYIVAHPTTVTGSIGVIMPLFGIEGLLGKIGIEPRTIKSGAMKDLGSMSVPLSSEARKILQDMVDEYQNRFVDMVLDGMTHRGVKITRTQLLTHTDGRVFTGEQARQLGFVDSIGYLDDALIVARKRAHLPANCRVVTYHKKPGLMELLFAKADAAKSGTVTLKIDGMPKMESRFMYLWMPGESFDVGSAGAGAAK